MAKGDNDKKKRWNGKKQAAAGEHVRELQTLLKKTGVYLSRIDGDFAGKTYDAVKRFQWNAQNIKSRIKNKALVTVSRTLTDKIDGIVGKNTKKELFIWKSKNYTSTGDLIRIKASEFDNIELSSIFKTITHPSIASDELVISSQLLDYLIQADTRAKELSITISLNQTFRVNGVKVSGAVVTPAKKSQHLIGHAIDCNIVDGAIHNNSNAFKKKQETKNAKKFIETMKENGMRWGGDFSKIDIPHFDKQVVSSTPKYNYKFFFNQRTISEKQCIKLKCW